VTALLLGADYYGTLAAVRCFGKHGIRTYVADEKKTARALWSKFTSERLVHPPIGEVDALLGWLDTFGREHPGTVLYPTNDHLAWLLARHRARIQKSFAIFHPGEEAIFSLLDKKRLAEVSTELGIDFPETTFANTDEELISKSADLRFPVLIKPRTQIFLESGVKGVLVSEREQLGPELARYHAMARFNRVLTDAHPDIARPLLQGYYTAAETSIFSVSGFVGEDGRVVARAAMKVLQRPRKVGIGLCFEGRDLEPSVADALSRLCKRVGYYGAFEAEFIADGERRMLIDFNPRFYSQMAFDIARGLPLPLLVHHAATGDKAAYEREFSRAAAWKSSGKDIYCHKWMLDLVLVLQGASGQLTSDDVKKWKAWFRDHESHATDAVRDSADRIPAFLDSVQWVQHFARHPRSFLRSYVWNK